MAGAGSVGRQRHGTRREAFRKVAPISPLLSNIYMRRFLLGWKVLGHAARLNAHIVNYADDLTILCRGTAEEAMTAMREMMARLKLTVNEEKTRLCRVPDSSFDFLGIPSVDAIRRGPADPISVRARPRRASPRYAAP